VIGRVQTGDDPFRIQRLPVNSCDDRALFLAKVDGAYDWLGPAQSAFRKLKRWSGNGRTNGSVHGGTMEIAE
jgi:hypothetical protein